MNKVYVIYDYKYELNALFRCLTYVRESVQRVATKSQLHKSNIETLLTDKVGTTVKFQLMNT